MVIVFIICLLLLVIAVFILVRSGPNPFLFDFMREVLGEKRGRHVEAPATAEDIETSKVDSTVIK